jgi:hypothetical protein
LIAVVSVVVLMMLILMGIKDQFHAARKIDTVDVEVIIREASMTQGP